jgi:hypothetical protein
MPTPISLIFLYKTFFAAHLDLPAPCKNGRNGTKLPAGSLSKGRQNPPVQAQGVG